MQKIPISAQKTFTAVFLLIQLILYILILIAGGSMLVFCSYTAIVLCFLYALLWAGQGSGWMLGGLACTVAADFFLVVCSPMQQLWGMVFFLGAQSLYAIKLHFGGKHKVLLAVRAALVLLSELVTVLVLREKTDPLALISICYYSNLIVNILAAFSQWKTGMLFPIGLVLFLLCDTVIGLQVASGTYLSISEDSTLYQILFMDFNLSWFFYLPSQVCIALASRTK